MLRCETLIAELDAIAKALPDNHDYDERDYPYRSAYCQIYGILNELGEALASSDRSETETMQLVFNTINVLGWTALQYRTRNSGVPEYNDGSRDDLIEYDDKYGDPFVAKATVNCLLEKSKSASDDYGLCQ